MYQLVPQPAGLPKIDGGKLTVPGDEPLKRELEDFVAAVREKRAPAVTGEQGRAALALADTNRGVDAAVNINLAIAERARAGEALTAAEIDELGTADILSLGMLADEVRRARVGDTVTLQSRARARAVHKVRRVHRVPELRLTDACRQRSTRRKR